MAGPPGWRARQAQRVLVISVDGTRGRPQTGVAENLSRRDGIRAGAVSGPWRSSGPATPRAEPGPAPKSPETAGPPPGLAPPPSWTGGADAATYAEPELDARSAYAAPRGSRWMAAWIAFGVLVAVGIVAAALALRPQIVTVSERTVPAAEEPAVAEIAAQGAVETTTPAAPEVAPPATASPIRFRIGADVTPEMTERVIASLEAAGHDAPRIEMLPFEIAQSRVGYYHAEDRPAAEALAALVAPMLQDGREVVVRDYGELLPDTEAGRLDLWIGN